MILYKELIYMLNVQCPLLLYSSYKEDFLIPSSIMRKLEPKEIK